MWLLPESGKNEGVPVEDYILRYKKLDIRGRTYLLPLYLAIILRARKIKYLWLSGWAIRADREIYWLARIMRMFGIEMIYDPIDPKVIYEIANRELTDPDKILKYQQSVHKIYGQCKRILCVTPEMKQLLVRYGVEEPKLFVARWGSDPRVFNRSRIKGDLRRKLQIDEATVLVGWLGSMVEFKGLREMLLPLIDKFAGDGGFHFLIAGEGPLFGEVEAWVASRKSTSITLLGRLPYGDAAEFTAALDAYLVTTNPDSEYSRAICPVKCYDAIAMGTPLITTRTPATEHLEHIGKNVHLCDYELGSIERELRKIASNIETVRESRVGRLSEDVSHHGVSREIADMLEGLAAPGTGHREKTT